MVFIPSFKRMLNPYQGYYLGCFLFGLLSLLYVTANSLPTNGQHLAAKDFDSSHSSDRRRLVYPSATFTAPLIKLEVHNEPEQDDFQSDEEYEIVSISENSDEILEKEIWTFSAENDADISEVKEEYSKAKRAVNKNTAKPKKKHKHSVKNTNKKALKNKKAVSETAKKRPPVKSKNQKKKAKKAISKHSNKNPAKNNKKSPKLNNKNPAKRVKNSAKRAKIVEKAAKSKQKVDNKIKQTTKRAPTVSKRTKPPKKATLFATYSTVEKGKENNSEKKTYFRHRPLTSNDRVLADDCDASISNGSFKLSFDVKPSDFFDERFQLNPNLKDEKCTLNILNNKEINIIVIDIVRNQATRFKRTLKDDELKEIIVHRRRGKKVRVRQQTNNETLEKITTISYRADESFDGPKLPLRNEYESETASYGVDKSFFRTESPLRKEHESETALYREDESIVRMKPPVLKEHESETISYGEDESFFRVKQPLLKEHESETASYGEDESFIRIKPPLRKEHESETVSYRADESFVRIKPPLRREHESETVSYRANESFVRIKPPLRKEHESETASYGEDESFVRKKPPLRKEHESETISNRAYASFVRLKPPFRMEQSQKHHEKSENWLVKQIADQHHGENYRTVTLEENASGNNDKVFQESGTEEQESSPSIQFESFTDLKNFINANILKVEGPHMLLLSKKFDPLLSEKTNTNDFLSRLNEKLLKIPRKFTITLSHFVPAKYIQKNTFYDILQTFQVSTEINPLSSNVENKSYVTQRVSGTCVFIPLFRQSFSQISTSPQGSVQLKLLNPTSLSKEYAGDLQGKFVLQMKQPCKAPVSSTQNGAEKDQKAVRDMKSSTDATADLDSAATTQPPTNSAIQYRMAGGKQFFPERTYQQQSVGIDYWMPEEVFGILFSKLFANTTMPQGIHKILGSKATTSGIETPNQLPINNPPISQRESGESVKNNDLHAVEDGNFRSLFKSKRKQAASNNEKIAGSDGADVYYEFRDGDIGDFTLDKGRLTPPDDDSFIESPADNEYEISQQEFGFEKRDSVVDSYDLDDFHGSFQLKTKGKTSNNEVSIGNNHRLLNHFSNNLLNHLESQDKDADDSTMRKKYQSMKSESPVNNSAKQKNFLGMFKLKPSFKTSNTQEPLNRGTFIEPLKDINRLILELKQKLGRGKNTSDNNENDSFEGMFKLKTKNEGLSNTESLKDINRLILELKQKLGRGKNTSDNNENDSFEGMFKLKTKNEGLSNTESLKDINRLILELKQKLGREKNTSDNNENDSFEGMFKLKTKNEGLSNTESLKDINRLMLELKQKLGRGKNTSDNNENDSFEGMFKLKTKNEGLSNTESQIVLAKPTDSSTQTEWLSWFLVTPTPNPEPYLGNGDLPEASVSVDKPIVKQEKHKPLKDNYEVENFHGIFRLKQNSTKNAGLSSNVDSILGNGGLAEPSVGVDKAVAEQKKHQSLKDREELENFHGAFTLKKNGPKNIGLSKNRIIDLLYDENELNEEDEGALLKICKSLRHGSPLHASNQNQFHGLFRLKPKLRRSPYQVKPYQKLTSAQEYEPKLMEKFHGLFRIKTEQEPGENGNAEMTRNFSPDENTFMDNYEVVFRLKPRKNEPDSLGKLYKLKTFPEWCKNYKRRKEPFWFS